MQWLVFVYFEEEQGHFGTQIPKPRQSHKAHSQVSHLLGHLWVVLGLAQPFVRRGPGPGHCGDPMLPVVHGLFCPLENGDNQNPSPQHH